MTLPLAVMIQSNCRIEIALFLFLQSLYERNKAMYKIGELSKLCNISVKALRYYDEVGLLIPDEIDKFTGYRYYSAGKLDDCYRIIALKELGFSLEEIKAQLYADSNEKIAASLNAKLARLNELIETTVKQLRRIETVRNNLIEGEQKMFNIIVRAADEMRVAFVRRNYLNKADALNEIDKIADSLPKASVGKRKLIINYETEYREEDFDLAACVEITGNLPKSTAYPQKTIGFGENVASLICKTDELDDAYKAMIKHLDASDCKVCGAYYEIYHDDVTVELKVPVCERTNAAVYRSEKTEVPFVDDPDACGKWKMIDVLPTREHFVYGKPKCGHPAWLDEIYFIDGGKSYWAVGGWTKGYLFTYIDKGIIKNKYTIENHGDRKLMFIEMKDCSKGSATGFGAPEIWVYEKESDTHYTSQDDFRRCDSIDYPFIKDDSVIGVWNVRDFVINKEDFDPQKQNRAYDDLFVLQTEFKDNGVYVFTTKQTTNCVTSTWTKGLILNKREKTASAYEIKIIDGKEYLFKEWKSGDYSFGGGRAYWYVFTRK